MKSRHCFCLLLAATFSHGASAQVQGASNPYARPLDMAPSDKAIPGRMDELYLGTQEAAANRAAEGARSAGRARPAKPSDVVAGESVFDDTGVLVGSIAGVEPDGAVVATTNGKVRVPVDAFGKNKAGLVISMSKAAFFKIVAQAVSG